MDDEFDYDDGVFKDQNKPVDKSKSSNVNVNKSDQDNATNDHISQELSDVNCHVTELESTVNLRDTIPHTEKNDHILEEPTDVQHESSVNVQNTITTTEETVSIDETENFPTKETDNIPTKETIHTQGSGKLSKYAIQATLSNDGDDADDKENFEEAQNQWNNVEEICIHETDSPSNETQTVSTAISIDETLKYFRDQNLAEYSNQIRPTITHSGFSALWNFVAGPPKLNKNLINERNLVFTIAAMKFDNSVEMHQNILQTIYKTLTKTRVDCPRFGGHWEVIGFQGNDPSTDLRGCGMLGLLTTLYFVSTKHSASLAQSVYFLSQDEVQNFPFAVMSINVTRICLQILRAEKLNKEINNLLKHKSPTTHGQVLDTFFKLYCSIFYKIYHIWKSQHKTMAESGFVLRDVEDSSVKNPTEVMRSYEQYHLEKKSKKPETSGDGKIESFVGIEDLSD